MSERSSFSSGIGVPGLIVVLFTGLKLTNHINWSWWWVFAPIWGTIAVVFVGVFAFLVVKGIWG